MSITAEAPIGESSEVAKDSRVLLARVITRAWVDPDYRTLLLTDATAALTEMGIEVRPGLDVRVIPDTSDTVHLVLPMPPEAMDDLETDLETYAMQPMSTHPCCPYTHVCSNCSGSGSVRPPCG
jgi:hypothetical protein